MCVCVCQIHSRVQPRTFHKVNALTGHVCHGTLDKSLDLISQVSRLSTPQLLNHKTKDGQTKLHTHCVHES